METGELLTLLSLLLRGARTDGAKGAAADLERHIERLASEVDAISSKESKILLESCRIIKESTDDGNATGIGELLRYWFVDTCLSSNDIWTVIRSSFDPALAPYKTFARPEIRFHWPWKGSRD